MARPTTYTEELALEICAQIIEGRSLGKICSCESMPSTVTVYRWLKDDPDFLRMYMLAKEDQADALAEEIIEIADEVPNVQVFDSEGTVVIVPIVLDAAAVQRQKLRIEARKWVASKLKPKRYGDRQELVGAGGQPLLAVDPFAGLTADQRMFEAARRIAFVLSKGANFAERKAQINST